MNILLFGISNVGKTTIGRIMAKKLNYDFYDLDDEVKSYYGYSDINEFIDKNSYRIERDKKRGYILEYLCRKEGNKVIAVAPIYYTKSYSTRLKKIPEVVVKIEIQDTPENIYKRLVFADDNDQAYTDYEYKERHKKEYLKAIKKEITRNKAAFSRIENKINIAGKDANKAADYIISAMHFD